MQECVLQRQLRQWWTETADDSDSGAILTRTVLIWLTSSVKVLELLFLWKAIISSIPYEITQTGRARTIPIWLACSSTPYFTVEMHEKCCYLVRCYFVSQFLVPDSSSVKDALGDTIPPAPPVLCSLFNLVPADAHFPEIFLDDIFPVLLRSTWTPPETLGFPYESLSWKSKVIHSWKMAKLSQTSASDVRQYSNAIMMRL